MIGLATFLGSPEPVVTRLLAFVSVLDSAGRYLTIGQCGLFGLDDYLLYMAYRLKKTGPILRSRWQIFDKLLKKILSLKDRDASERKINRIIFRMLWDNRSQVVDLLETEVSRSRMGLR